MEYGLLFRKTSTCYKNPDIEYLDETSDYKLKILMKQGEITEEEFHQKHAELERTISYLTKENHGRVYAGGFVRDELLSKKGKAPEKWDNQTRKHAIMAAVCKVSRKYGTYRKTMGHKMVFSVSEELEKKVENAGLNLDDILGRQVKKIMYEFQHKFHPGEKIGFAWGIHHDTKHRHVHVYLCNRTDQGTHVALSNPLKGRIQIRQRKDQIGYMKERCTAAVKRIENLVDKSKQNIAPKRVSAYKVEHQSQWAVQSKIAVEREHKLEEMRRTLISKENQLKLKQISIRQHSSHYYLQREFITRGWNDIKEINYSIQNNYQKLKKNEQVISPKLLRKLGYISDSGPVKFFSRMLYLLHNEANFRRRQSIVNQIQKSKEYKIQLLNQLQLLDKQKKIFQQEIRELKLQREQLRQDFFQKLNEYEKLKAHYDTEDYQETVQTIEPSEKPILDLNPEIPLKYDWELLQKNFEFFRENVSDRNKWQEYRDARMNILEKEERGEDYSHELKILKKFDEEALNNFNQIDSETNKEIESEMVLEYDWDRIQANFEFFRMWIEDRGKWEEYRSLKISILEKDERGEDYSQELKRLKILDREAENAAGVESFDIPETSNHEEEIKAKYIDLSLPKTDEDQDKGIKL